MRIFPKVAFLLLYLQHTCTFTPPTYIFGIFPIVITSHHITSLLCLCSSNDHFAIPFKKIPLTKCSYRSSTTFTDFHVFPTAPHDGMVHKTYVTHASRSHTLDIHACMHPAHLNSLACLISLLRSHSKVVST